MKVGDEVVISQRCAAPYEAIPVRQTVIAIERDRKFTSGFKVMIVSGDGRKWVDSSFATLVIKPGADADNMFLDDLKMMSQDEFDKMFVIKVDDAFVTPDKISKGEVLFSGPMLERRNVQALINELELDLSHVERGKPGSILKDLPEWMKKPAQ